MEYRFRGRCSCCERRPRWALRRRGVLMKPLRAGETALGIVRRAKLAAFEADGIRSAIPAHRVSHALGAGRIGAARQALAVREIVELALPMQRPVAIPRDARLLHRAPAADGRRDALAAGAQAAADGGGLLRAAAQGLDVPRDGAH